MTTQSLKISKPTRPSEGFRNYYGKSKESGITFVSTRLDNLNAKHKAELSRIAKAKEATLTSIKDQIEALTKKDEAANQVEIEALKKKYYSQEFEFNIEEGDVRAKLLKSIVKEEANPKRSKIWFRTRYKIVKANS